MALPKVPTGIETRANEAFDEVRVAVDTFQPTYFNAHGRYWQGLQNPPVTPKDGNERGMELSQKPTDQAEDWSWFSPATGYPISIEVHVHERHGEHWYSVIGKIEIGGDKFVRVNDGEWEKVIPIE